jgi:hypothetical protein
MLKTVLQAVVLLAGAMFLVIWINNFTAGPQSTQSNHYQRAEKSNTDYCSDNYPDSWGKRLRCDPVADFTGLLALFTAVLAAVSWIEIQYLRRAETRSGELADIAQKQMLITARQTDIIEKQHAVGRLQFLTTHRPRITVRAFKPHLEGVVVNKYPVEFIYLNEGGNDAFIKEIGTAVFSGTGPWTYGARKVRFDIEGKDNILKGGQSEIEITKGMFPMIETDTIPSRTRGIDWYCVGYIKYRSASDTFDRSTGFCRRWDFESHTWERYSDEEHEHAY